MIHHTSLAKCYHPPPVGPRWPSGRIRGEDLKPYLPNFEAPQSSVPAWVQRSYDEPMMEARSGHRGSGLEPARGCTKASHRGGPGECASNTFVFFKVLFLFVGQCQWF